MLHAFFSLFPAWLTLLILTVVPATTVTIVHAIFRRRVSAQELREQQEVAGFLVAVVAVIYAVVLGFIVVTASIAFDSAQRNADAEAGDVADIAGLSRLLDEPQRSALHRLIGQYAFEVRDVEWGMLSREQVDLKARDTLFQVLYTFELPIKRSPDVDVALSKSAIRQHVLEEIHDLRDHRRQRLIDAKSHLPSVMYLALFLGAIFVVAFAFLFGVENAVLQLSMTFIVTASISMLVALVFMLDRPYAGTYHVNSDAWTTAIFNYHLSK
jgi:Protein of unknown function (DUF4239)